MKKLLIILLMISLVACQQVPESDVPTHEIVDGLGRHVEVPVQVEKVACIFAVSGHITVMLGEGDKIVSVTSGLKRDVMMTDLVPSILEATEPKNGGSINIEELLRDKPDVAFIASDIALNEDETAKLDKFHIPYLTVAYESIEEQQETIRMIAKVYHKEAEAEIYIDYYNRIVNEVSEAVKDVTPVTAYHAVNEATRTSYQDSVPSDWFGYAGFDLVSNHDELRYSGNDYYASLEQILEWNPQVIFCNENGVDDYIMTDSKWQALDAVKNKTVYMLPVGITRWGHTNSLEVPLAKIYTTKLVYPDEVSHISLEDEMKYFYKTFFNIDVTDDMIKDILNGDGMRIRKEDVK